VKIRANEEFSNRERRQLEDKLRQALAEEIRTLSTEKQQIICDDLVTAFRNRLIVLTEAK
jgi:hypothetical protein